MGFKIFYSWWHEKILVHFAGLVWIINLTPLCHFSSYDVHYDAVRVRELDTRNRSCDVWVTLSAVCHISPPSKFWWSTDRSPQRACVCWSTALEYYLPEGSSIIFSHQFWLLPSKKNILSLKKQRWKSLTLGIENEVFPSQLMWSMGWRLWFSCAEVGEIPVGQWIVSRVFEWRSCNSDLQALLEALPGHGRDASLYIITVI